MKLRITSRRPSHFAPSGFTLIELLTVIAVIGVLAAILIPAVSRTRQKASLAECASTQRNVGQAMLLYQQDHGGKLPGPINTGQDAYHAGRSGQLVTLLAPYLGYPVEPTFRAEKAFGCPATIASYARTPSDAFPYAPVWRVNISVETTNGTVINPWGYPGSKGADPANTLQIDLANTVALRDLDLKAGDPGWPNVPPEPVHGSARNLLYFDGHVEARPVEEALPF
jgi:prepilin-type N-terminal cleavage/methylation domain-containing protein/prepilin-type processing-associated H-X9-DG protein